MTSMTKRVLTTAITLPVLFIMIYFLPQRSHAALSALAVLTAIAAASEMRGLFAKASVSLPRTVPLLIGLLPLAQWVEIAYRPALPIVDLSLMGLALVFFSMEIIVGKADHYKGSLLRIGAKALLLVYPGLLITYIQRLTSLAFAAEALLLFFLLIFGNDVFAFVFGIWLGKGNRGVVQVSPNKSLAGFVGGTVSAMALGLLFCLGMPNAAAHISPAASLLVGFATATAANIGDLIESAFKRSVDVKDSGHLIPGRGGLLDSIDSMLVGAPIFWLLLTML
ncbi:MAG: phosphatidate cytidylyltransferase [Sphaerochaeta sp.]|nr:phosphatidate cytidylyltransferase [Sphaerochaeta sp.]MDX9914975.1 phosphatidate cytidylyltransferase [Sphaerochaeta sp.]